MTRSSFQRGFVSNPIRTRSGIVFEIRYRVRTGDGTWKHKSERLHGLDGKKAARAVLEEKLRGASIEVIPVKDLTMQDFVDQYWKSYIDRIEAKPSTRKSYGSILSIFFQVFDSSYFHRSCLSISNNWFKKEARRFRPRRC
jgi:hypothetical protein